jgi:hypothetical protein
VFKRSFRLCAPKLRGVDNGIVAEEWYNTVGYHDANNQRQQRVGIMTELEEEHDARVSGVPAMPPNTAAMATSA